MRNQKIFVAGHRGMVGSAIVRTLEYKGAKNIITRTKEQLDLKNQVAVREFFESERPDQVYLAAARVGGIHANSTYPADFIYDNLMIECNVIESAFRSGVKKLLFLGSSCIYPKLAPQPMSEEVLLSGPLEPTNEPYAIAKIAGIKLCQNYNVQYGASHSIDYRCLMPTNLYGPGDNYRSENSHVIPALIRRFHEAKLNGSKSVKIWGSGVPMREFLYVDDMASACAFIMDLPRSTYELSTGSLLNHINVGYGSEISIHELAQLIRSIVGFVGDIEFDESKPDGAPRKLMDSSRINNLGWYPSMELKSGLEITYSDYVNNPSARI